MKRKEKKKKSDRNLFVDGGDDDLPHRQQLGNTHDTGTGTGRGTGTAQHSTSPNKTTPRPSTHRIPHVAMQGTTRDSPAAKRRRLWRCVGAVLDVIVFDRCASHETQLQSTNTRSIKSRSHDMPFQQSPYSCQYPAFPCVAAMRESRCRSSSSPVARHDRLPLARPCHRAPSVHPSIRPPVTMLPCL